jgi:hypothetical protein
MERELPASPEVIRALAEALERTEDLGNAIAEQLADAEREIEEIKRYGLPPS